MRIIEYCITKETKNQNQNEYLYNEWQGNQATRRMTETTRQRQKQETSRQKNKKGYNNKQNSKRTEVKTKILTQQQQK